MSVKIDPEFAALVPPLSDAEYTILEQSILDEGCREALIVWGDTLIDGHNRLKICERNDIKFETKQIKFVSRYEALTFIVNNQLGRRNLSKASRCLLALELEPDVRAEARKRQQNAGGALVQNSAQAGTKTRIELAKIAGVSHHTFERVKQIKLRGTSEQLQRIIIGESSINAVYNELPPLPKPKKEKPSTELPDSLRATSATYKLVVSKGDIKSVQGDTGHATAKMVTDTYAKIQDKSRKKMAEALEQGFYKDGKQPQPTSFREDAAARMLNSESESDDSEILPAASVNEYYSNNIQDNNEMILFQKLKSKVSGNPMALETLLSALQVL